MSQYAAVFTDSFKKAVKQFKNHSEVSDRLRKKTKEICEDPLHFKPLSNVMKGQRRTHIGSYVLTFMVDENEWTVTFLNFQHHDDVYK